MVYRIDGEVGEPESGSGMDTDQPWAGDGDSLYREPSVKGHRENFGDDENIS